MWLYKYDKLHIESAVHFQLLGSFPYKASYVGLSL